MTEKQASSEIAKSRERFEKKWADDYFDGIFPVNWDSEDGAYAHAEVQNSWLSWQAAERDTRERVANLVREECEKYDDKTEPGRTVIQALVDVVERIRGKV